MAKSLLFDLADDLAKKAYKISLDFSYKHQSSIGDQLRRAVLSVVLNIVEGGARKTVKEKRQFLNIAFSSLKEVKYLIYFCREMKMIEEKDFSIIIEKINYLAKLLYGFLYKKDS